MITALFTKKNNLGSYLIRKITSSPASHFAIAFDKKVVFESTITGGVHLSFYSEFMEKNQVIWAIDTEHSLPLEDSVWSECAKLDGLRYDYIGALYLAIKLIQRDIMGQKVPIANKFGDNGLYFCLELARGLKPIFNIPDDASVKTPKELHDILAVQVKVGA